MNEEKSSNMPEKDKKSNKDKDEINSDCLGDAWRKIHEDCSKEKFIILRIIKILLRFLLCFGMVKIFLKLYHGIINAFNKYILRSKTRKETSQNEQDVLIVIILFLLLLILKFFPILQNCNISNIVVFLTVWRLIDILVYQLSIIFLSEGKYIITADIFRSILLWLINLLEIISIYAILYLTTQGIEMAYEKDIQLIKPLEALYFSITTVSTTGFGEMIPKKGWGQFLASTEIIIGIFMLIVFLGILIGRWKDKKDKNDRSMGKGENMQS